MKNIKMKTKLIIMFIVTGLIPMLILSFFLERRMTEEMTSQALNQNSTFLALKRDEVDEYYTERAGDGEILSKSPDIYEGLELLLKRDKHSPSWNEEYNRMDTILGVTVEESGLLDIFITDNNGNIVIAYQYKDDLEGINLSMREYIKKGLSGTQNWSELFYSEFIGDNTIALSTPIYKGGDSTAVIGTINILIDQQKMDEIVHGGIERIGISGNAYMVNEEGLLLTNTMLGEYIQNAAMKITIDTKVTRELSTAIINQDTQFEFTGIYEDYLGNNVLGSAGILKMGDSYVGVIVEVDEAEALSFLNTMKRITIIFVGIAAILGVLITLYLASIISKPLVVAAKQSNIIANLDISKNIPDKLINRKDEIGDLSKSLQSIINSLRNIIRDIRRSSEQVAASSEELTTNSQQSAMAAEEVSRTVEEIARSTSEQAKNTEEGSTKALELGKTIENDQTYLKDVNKITQKVFVVVNEGLKEIEKLTDISEESRKATNEVQEEIIKTNDSADSIGNASTVIASIAEQTNLLSLNAAIEAARAGDAGKGFAVVADEIRKLAEQSAISTKSIDQVVNELQNNSKSAVKIMERVATILKEQKESVKLSKEKYMTIGEVIKEAENAVKKLNVSGEEMEKMKDEIMDTLQNLSAIAEENSAATQQVSASMEEETASMEEISSASEGLASLAQDLQAIIMKIKL